MLISNLLDLSSVFYKFAEFDKWYFDRLPTFKDHHNGYQTPSDERELYLEKNTKFLNEGSGRKVYKLSDRSVLKVAIDRFGIIQNKVEYSILKRGNFSDLLPKVFDRSEDYSWIEVEFVTEVPGNEISELSGVDPEDLVDLMASRMKYSSFENLILQRIRDWNNEIKFKKLNPYDPEIEIHFMKKNIERYTSYLDNKFLKKSDELIKLFKLNAREFALISNYGKSSSGNLVFLDLGVLSV